jgi:hypothetical protein
MAHLLDRHALACADAGNAPCGLQAFEEEGALLSTQCVRRPSVAIKYIFAVSVARP